MADITELLHRWQDGRHDAENELFAVVFPDLRDLARCLMKGESKEHSMQATDLVDQIYRKLVQAKDRDWQNRGQFFAIAGRAMRIYLIDHARAKPNTKFIGLEDLQEMLQVSPAKVELAVTVGELLEQLAETKPEWCRLVEVKYFLGLTDEEAANALGMKLRTMQRMWLDARQWLFARLEGGNAGES